MLSPLSPHGVVEPRRARRRPPLRAGGGAHPAARVVVALVPAPVARLEPPGVVESGGPVTMVHVFVIMTAILLTSVRVRQLWRGREMLTEPVNELDPKIMLVRARVHVVARMLQAS